MEEMWKKGRIIVGVNEFNDRQGCNEDLDLRSPNLCVPWWIRDCNLLVIEFD